MEQETSAADSKPGVNNGDVSEKQESKKLTGVKRKLEEDETDTKTEVEQSGTKRARVNGEVCPPSSKSSSSVSERLGTPDPTFLATYSSPSCFNRAYVPNPAVPALTVDPARLFSVVSYNILAECARTRNDYSYTAPEFLGQELGYDGLMMKRTKDYYDEGEATFYKTALFELESSKRVSLTEVARKPSLPARPRWLLSDASIRKLQAVERLELNEGSGSEPEITTFTVHMHNSVDYVFFSSGSLVPVGVLKTVDKAVVDATGGLPDRDFASDHLAMKAVMAFTN
nr:hypothetical protein BaRGS_025574 [Batillaria attramentaria]